MLVVIFLRIEVLIEVIIHRGKSADMFGARFAAGGGVFALVLRQQHKSPIVWLRGWVCVKLHVRNNRLFNVTVPMWWIWGRIMAAEAVYCRCNVAEAVLLPPLRWRVGFCGRAGEFYLRRRHRSSVWQAKTQQRLPFTAPNASGRVRRVCKSGSLDAWHARPELAQPEQALLFMERRFPRFPSSRPPSSRDFSAQTDGHTQIDHTVEGFLFLFIVITPHEITQNHHAF